MKLSQVLLIGVGGFALYEIMKGYSMPLSTPSTPISPNVAPNSPTAANISVTPTPVQTTGDAVNTMQLMAKASAKLAGAYDEVNYYYNQVTGHYGKNWEDTSFAKNGMGRGDTITYTQFLTEQGVSGLSALSGGLGFAIQPSFYEVNLYR